MDKRKMFDLKGAWMATLTREDMETLQGLCESCSDYYQLHGEVDVPTNAAEELFYEIPPGKTVEDKFIVGLFKGKGEMIGIIETIKGYPEDTCWYIGQMMIDPKYQRQGIGHDFFQRYESWIYGKGAEKIRLGVLQENEKAYGFWQDLGFEKVYIRENYKIKNKVTVVYVMEKKYSIICPLD